MKLWQTASDEPDELAERVERFTAEADVGHDQTFVRYDILGSMAHARMLGEIGVLTHQESARLHHALQAILENPPEVTPEDEDVHTAVENRLMDELGDLGAKLHTGRSRNDQILVDTRLFTKDALIRIAHRAIEAGESLTALARQHERTPMPGETHTRQAMPSTVGLLAAAYAEGLSETLGPLEATFALNDRCPLGAAAGYGAPRYLDRERTAELLGFSDVQTNVLNAIHSRGSVEFQTVNTLGTMMLVVGRLAEDLIRFSSEAFGFFELPEAMTTGSSIMPHKRNPDVAELLRARTGSVIAEGTQIALTMKGLSQGYHRDTQETKGALMRALTSTEASLEMLPSLVDGLTVNEARLRDAMRPELFVTDRVFDLVDDGVSFREAYRQVKTELANGTDGKMPETEAWLARRSSLGAPGNLGLDRLDERLAAAKTAWRAESETLSSTLRRLADGQFGKGGER